MKNLKKLVLSLGTIASIAAPVAAVIACGSSSNNNTNPATEGNANPGNNTDGTGGTGPSNFVFNNTDSVFASIDALIAYVQIENIERILESIKNISYEDVEGFLKTVTTEKVKVLLNALVKEVTDTNGNTTPFIVKFIKAFELEKQVYIDAITNVMKTISSKSTADGSTDNLQLVFNLIKPLLPSDQDSTNWNFVGNLLGSDVLKKLLGHMVDETDENGDPVYVKDENGQDTTVVKQVQVGYTDFAEFKTDFTNFLRTFLSEETFTVEYTVAGGDYSYDVLMEAVKTKGHLVDSTMGGVGKGASYAFNKIVTDGLKVGSISNLLAGIAHISMLDAFRFWESKEFNNAVNLIYKLEKLDHPEISRLSSQTNDQFAQYLVDKFAVQGGGISTSIYNFLKKPLTSLTSDDFKNIIVVINSAYETSISLELGDAIYDVVHNSFDASLGSISVILDTIKGLIPSSSSIIDTFETIIPTFLIGEDKVKSEEVDIKAELTKLRTQLTESTIEDGKAMPEGYGENTYSNLMDRFNEEAKQHIEDYDPMRARYALTKIEGIKIEMDDYNAAIDALSAARADFATNYNSSSQVTPMNTITAADTKYLDKAYEAVAAKLASLYNLDLDNSKLEDINNAKTQIEGLEGVVGEINLAINSLNGGATVDTTPLFDKIKNLKVVVDGLSPINKAVFDTFEAAFNAASDDKRKRGLGHLVFSQKSEILGKFIDDNSLLLFGSKISPDFAHFTTLEFLHSFEGIGTDYQILSTSESIDGNVQDFVDNIIKKIISPEEFAKLQENLLDLLAY